MSDLLSTSQQSQHVAFTKRADGSVVGVVSIHCVFDAEHMAENQLAGINAEQMGMGLFAVMVNVPRAVIERAWKEAPLITAPEHRPDDRGYIDELLNKKDEGPQG
jgi:hypothetical protein